MGRARETIKRTTGSSANSSIDIGGKERSVEGGGAPEWERVRGCLCVAVCSHPDSRRVDDTRSSSGGSGGNGGGGGGIQAKSSQRYIFSSRVPRINSSAAQ